MTKPPPTTSAQRQTKLRETRRAKGLKKLELWVKPEHREQVKAFAASCGKPKK